MYLIVVLIVILLIVGPIWLFVSHFTLRSRVRELEDSLLRLEKRMAQITTPSKEPEKLPSTPVFQSTEVRARLETSTTPQAQVHEEKPAFIPPPQESKEKVELESFASSTSSTPQPPTLLSKLIKNWTGVLGILILIIGLAFFGVLTSLYLSAAARVAILLCVGAAFVLVNRKLRYLERWRELGAWLQVAGGALILFTCVGASRVPGLLCITNQAFGTLLIIAGLLTNVALSWLANRQAIASLHVLFSITALMVLPASPLVLILGSLITVAGCALSYRSRWDVHLFASLLAYALFHALWHEEMHSYSKFVDIRSWGICSLLVVGISAGFVHYRKEYESSQFQALPFCVHLFNWSMLACGLFTYSHGSWYTIIYLALAALVAQSAALFAKRRGINWVYATDSLVSQLLIILALSKLGRWGVPTFDCALLVYAEVLIFCVITCLYKQIFLLRIGFATQWLLSAVVGYLTLQGAVEGTFINSALDFDNLSLSLRFLLLAGLTASAVEIFFRNKLLDSEDFVCSGKSSQSRSYLSVVSTVAFLFAYVLIVNEPWAATSFVAIFALAACGTTKYGAYSIKPIATAWGFGHGASLITLGSHHEAELNEFIAYYLPWLIGDILLWISCIWQEKNSAYLAKNSAKIAQAAQMAIYLFFAFTAFCCYHFCIPLSPFAPGACYLVGSLLFLALALSRSKRSPTIDDHRHFFQAGSYFLLLFLFQHFTVHLDHFERWLDVPLRVWLEIAGAIVLACWAYATRGLVEGLGKYGETTKPLLFDATLAFILFILGYENDTHWHPLIWSASAVLLIVLQPKLSLPNRFHHYSWLLQLASCLKLVIVAGEHIPQLPWWQQTSSTGVASIIVQTYYVIMAYRTQHISEKLEFPLCLGAFRSLHSLFLMKWKNRAIFYPFALSVAGFLFWQFERGILTLLWVFEIGGLFSLGLYLKERHFVKVALMGLVFCALRLFFYDLAQTNLAVRAAVFILVGLLVVGIDILRKKYEDRISGD